MIPIVLTFYLWHVLAPNSSENIHGKGSPWVTCLSRTTPFQNDLSCSGMTTYYIDSGSHQSSWTSTQALIDLINLPLCMSKNSNRDQFTNWTLPPFQLYCFSLSVQLNSLLLVHHHPNNNTHHTVPNINYILMFIIQS